MTRKLRKAFRRYFFQVFGCYPARSEYLAMLLISVSVASSTVINLPDNSYLAVIPFTDVCADSGTQPCSAVPVSTGPVIIKSENTPDCYQIDYVNANGTLPPATWVPCP